MLLREGDSSNRSSQPHALRRPPIQKAAPDASTVSVESKPCAAARRRLSTFGFEWEATPRLTRVWVYRFRPSRRAETQLGAVSSPSWILWQIAVSSRRHGDISLRQRSKRTAAFDAAARQGDGSEKTRTRLRAFPHLSAINEQRSERPAKAPRLHIEQTWLFQGDPRNGYGLRIDDTQELS